MKTMYKHVLLSVALFAGAATTVPSKEAAVCFFKNIHKMANNPQALFTKERKNQARGLKTVDLFTAATAVKALSTSERSDRNSALKILTGTLQAVGGSLAAGILLTLAGDDFVPFCKHYGKKWFDETASSSDSKEAKKTATDLFKHFPSRAAWVKGLLRLFAAIFYVAGQNNWNPLASIQAGIKNGFGNTLNAFLETELTTEEKAHFVINTFIPFFYAMNDNNVEDTDLDFENPTSVESVQSSQ